jgi:hypothetical protein
MGGSRPAKAGSSGERPICPLCRTVQAVRRHPRRNSSRPPDIAQPRGWLGSLNPRPIGAPCLVPTDPASRSRSRERCQSATLCGRRGEPVASKPAALGRGLARVAGSRALGGIIAQDGQHRARSTGRSRLPPSGAGRRSPQPLHVPTPGSPLSRSEGPGDCRRQPSGDVLPGPRLHGMRSIPSPAKLCRVRPSDRDEANGGRIGPVDGLERCAR